MKKILTLILALSLVAATLAACGGNKAPETTVPETTEAVETAPATVETEQTEITEDTEATAPVDLGLSADALAVLENIWADYAQDEQFPIAGGDFDSGTFHMGAPGAFPMSAAEGLKHTLLITDEQLTMVDGAATMLHGMNANIFTSGVLHMTEGTDMAAFAEAVREALKDNQWICGAPETMLLAVIDNDYLLISFGNAELMGIFQTHVEAVYPETEVLFTDAIFE